MTPLKRFNAYGLPFGAANLSGGATWAPVATSCVRGRPSHDSGYMVYLPVVAVVVITGTAVCPPGHNVLPAPDVIAGLLLSNFFSQIISPLATSTAYSSSAMPAKIASS